MRPNHEESVITFQIQSKIIPIINEINEKQWLWRKTRFSQSPPSFLSHISAISDDLDVFLPIKPKKSYLYFRISPKYATLLHKCRNSCVFIAKWYPYMHSIVIPWELAILVVSFERLLRKEHTKNLDLHPRIWCKNAIQSTQMHPKHS